MDAEKCKWLESPLLVDSISNYRKRNIFKKIIQYNKDDCFATLKIAEYLIKNQLKKN